MKLHTTLLLLFFFLSTASLRAQIFDFEVDQLHVEFDVDPNNTDQTIKTYGKIINHTNRPITLHWQRIEHYLAPGWESAVCNNENCYLPNTSEYLFEIPADSSGTFDVYLYTYGLPGDSARIEIRVNTISDTTTVISKVYTYDSSGGTFIEEADASIPELRILPNPTTNFFKVRSNESVGKVELYSIIGSKVRTYSPYADMYDVSDLPRGMYLVRVLNTSGDQILKTQRIKVQ